MPNGEVFYVERPTDHDFNLAYLDSVEFKSYLKPDMSIKEIMFEIEGDYEYRLREHPILEGRLFKHLTTDEVAEYLSNRYHLNLRPSVNYSWTKEA